MKCLVITRWIRQKKYHLGNIFQSKSYGVPVLAIPADLPGGYEAGTGEGRGVRREKELTCGESRASRASSTHLDCPASHAALVKQRGTWRSSAAGPLAAVPPRARTRNGRAPSCCGKWASCTRLGCGEGWTRVRAMACCPLLLGVLAAAAVMHVWYAESHNELSQCCTRGQ